MKNTLPTDTIDYIIKHGFRVYMRDSTSSYAFVESEDGICYLQYEYGGYSLNTVHQANRETGTGYRLYSELENVTPKLLNETIKTSVPHWDLSRKPPCKYASMEEYCKVSEWNSGHKEIVRPNTPIVFP